MLLRSIGRFLRSILYALTGRVDSARRDIDRDPNVIRAKFDAVLREKKESIQNLMTSVGTLRAQQFKKKDKLKRLMRDQKTLTTRKTGAVAMANKRAKELQSQGKATPEIKQDEVYQRCLSGFQDLSSSLQRVEEEILSIESDIKTNEASIQKHKITLERFQRDIQDIKREAADTVAAVISATEEKRIYDMISEISTDRTGEELEELRELRHQVTAEAKVSAELAGTDAEAQMREFDQFAAQAAASSEFDQLIGLEEEAPSEAPAEEAPVEEDTAPPGGGGGIRL